MKHAYVECASDDVRWIETEGSILVPTSRCVVITIGVQLKSQGQWSHNWRAIYGRTQQVRKRVSWTLGLISELAVLTFLGDVRAIKLIRLAPRRIEKHDNLPIVFKPVVDQVTCWLAHDNRPNARARDGEKDGYTFTHHQQKQHAYGARVELWP